jgi:1-acyl-sn-glycerol-3-phosphate acyltransferase
VAVAKRRLNFWQWFAVVTIKPVLRGWTRRTWSGMDQIPASGGVIIAANHLSEFDPLAVAHFVYDSGRWPQFLAKSSLFKIVGLGPFFSAVKQIPVYRGTTDAVKSLEAAIKALESGDAVIVYPEGTTPKQGDLWPQRGKTGVARMFLATGVPVIPVVTWGPQHIMDPRSRKLRLRPRTPVSVMAGPPVDLSAWKDAAPTSANLYAITDQIMIVLRDMLAELRQEPAPEQPSAAGKRNGNGGTT